MKERVANTFVIKCLKELNIYGSFIKAVKNQHKGNYSFIKKTILGNSGKDTIDYGITWCLHRDVDWCHYHQVLIDLCNEHKDEYEKGWIYKNS